MTIQIADTLTTAGFTFFLWCQSFSLVFVLFLFQLFFLLAHTRSVCFVLSQPSGAYLLSPFGKVPDFHRARVCLVWALCRLNSWSLNKFRSSDCRESRSNFGMSTTTWKAKKLYRNRRDCALKSIFETSNFCWSKYMVVFNGYIKYGWELIPKGDKMSEAAGSGWLCNKTEANMPLFGNTHHALIHHYVYLENILFM